MTWKDKIRALLDISIGLEHLHSSNFIHRDLHPGNLLFSREKDLLITDLGLCKQADQCKQTDGIYGVMPYLAPEILQGKRTTKESDIYSFGMIMYFIATEKQPFGNHAHDCHLALSICNGCNPELDNNQVIPKCYVDLMKKCWNLNPEKRPTAIEVKKLVKSFYQERSKQIKLQFEEAEKCREEILSTRNEHIYSQTQYISRLVKVNSYIEDTNIDCKDNKDFSENENTSYSTVDCTDFTSMN